MFAFSVFLAFIAAALPAQADTIFSENFDAGAGGFGFVPGAFGTGDEDVDGEGEGGGLGVEVGHGDPEDPESFSGGWARPFNLAAASDVSITLDYYLEFVDSEGSGVRIGEALISVDTVDGTTVSFNGNPYLAQLTADGDCAAGPIIGGISFRDRWSTAR